MSHQINWSFGKLMLLGASSFWLPDVLWHAVIARRNLPGLWDVIVPTASMPLALLATYLFLKRQPVSQSAQNIGLPLVLGIWTLGGFFMAVGASFSGGGFVGPDGLRDGVIGIMMGFVPPLTYIMAGYDGSLGALILATLAAVLFAVRMRWTHPKNPATP